MSVELVADLVLHEFNKLVLYTGALCLCSHHFPFGSMLALSLIIILLLGIRSGKVHGKKPVHHHVRIEADWRGEMRVVFECQTVMADVVGAVTGLGHGTEGKHLYRIILRSALRLGKQAVQFL